MIELTIDHVIAKTTGDAEPEAGPRRVVLLREQAGGRVLPIWIGAPEAEALAFGLAGETPPRPLPHDLTLRLLEAVGARVERVTINRLAEKTFYAVVTVAAAAGTSELDARPSDALNLAARAGAAVFVTEDVLEQAGVAGENVEQELDAVARALGGRRQRRMEAAFGRGRARCVGGADAEVDSGGWRPLSPSAGSRSATAGSRRSPASTSRWPRASSSGCSGRTAPASRRS